MTRIKYLLPLLALFVSVCAKADIASGTCGKDGDNITWVISDDGTLTLSGSGEMKDYDWNNYPWFSNKEKIIKVSISEGITNIGNNAFYSCSSLTSVTIPNSVTSIGEAAFAGCPGLVSLQVGSDNPNFCVEENVLFNKDKTKLICCAGGKSEEYSIPASVTSIGEYAFSDCSSLTSVTIPNSVTSIGKRVFSGCRGLTSVTIPNSVTSIGEYAFQLCGGLTSVTIPNSVTSIGYKAFYGCSSLTSITIPNSVTSIGEYAFSYCSRLTSVTIPNSVTSIEKCTFAGCRRLTSITIPNSVTSIGDYAFSDCNDLTSVDIPNSVTSIGVGAFDDCGITSVIIPNSMTSIGDGAFIWSNLTSVTIPNSVTSIGEEAFRECELTSVTIPSSVASIGDKAFSGCSKLSEITCEAIEVPTATDGTFENTLAQYGTLHVPEQSVEKYKLAEGWRNWKFIGSIEEVNAETDADKFKTDHATILNKTISTVASSDLDAITEALDEYNELSKYAKTFLAAEKYLLDHLKEKAEELKAAEEAAAAADAAATEDADKFKSDNKDILDKDINDITPDDLAAINKALDDYDKLSEAAKAKLTDGEKDLLDNLKTKAEALKAAEEADAAATAEAEKFKADNAAILAKTTETVASTDIEAINKALGDYDGLSEAAKAKLTDGEKDLLDALKTKAEELKAAEEAAAAADAAAKADAENFKADNKDILDKSLDSITPDDLAAIDKALSDYDKLSEAAKAKLTDGEKSDLDSKKAKAEELASSISALIKTGADVYYNMNGQRTNRSAKGILIKNGKKVLVR